MLSDLSRHSQVARLALATMLAATAALTVACSGTPTPEPVEPDDSQPQPSSKPHGTIPAVDAEVGALDEGAVKQAFSKAMPLIDACLKSAQDKLPFIEGEIEVFVRVAGDGSTAWSYPRKATFGHRATEQCIVDAIAAQQWPKPEGGREGQTTQYLDIRTNERAAVAWNAADLGHSGAKLMSRLRSCRSQHGAASLSITFYVDPDGKLLAAGAATGDESGRDALTCAVDAPKGLRFNSPGSYPAKVTISTE